MTASDWPERPSNSRELVLGRIRAALGDAAGVAEQPLPRDYLTAHVPTDDPAAVLDLLHRNLADYRALVHRCHEDELPRRIAGLLVERGSRTVVVPAGLPADWLTAAEAEGVELLPDDGTLTAARLDAVDSVVTGCALAVAETGTIVLDAGPGQGRRLLSLVPDHHVCVVRAPEQVVASVPLALPRLDPVRPQTWISGPSATSDIELDRVEGVHGPRTLEVLLLTAAPEPDDARHGIRGGTGGGTVTPA
ncbi:lactate utilization protein C [Kitasatospora xanthocidica]|uniref:Lactate utilization protein C n=1 Tax=Kitasatospora xanthocidica TaxID=83382 RepID=A0A372ZIE6_9ACTN|nr:LUD domain-containing protein [Kitasatospora xanthocidica]RGD55619.1 lactate utilization protein C [Kitasatospora xanthocidica]